jgi:hypothetical protein
VTGPKLDTKITARNARARLDMGVHWRSSAVIWWLYCTIISYLKRLEHLLRTKDSLGAVAPATTALQRVNDPTQHTPVINMPFAAQPGRQNRLDP